MAFTLTGDASDLDLDLDHLPTLTVTHRLTVLVDVGTVRTREARGGFDRVGRVVKRGTDEPWVIGAPQGTPLHLTSSAHSSIPPVPFVAPADGEALDLAALLATLPQPAPSPSAPYVKGDKGDKGDRGPMPTLTATAATVPPTSPAAVTVTRTGDGYTLALDVPQGAKGERGDPGPSSIGQDPTTRRLYWTGA